MTNQVDNEIDKSFSKSEKSLLKKIQEMRIAWNENMKYIIGWDLNHVKETHKNQLIIHRQCDMQYIGEICTTLSDLPSTGTTLSRKRNTQTHFVQHLFKNFLSLSSKGIPNRQLADVLRVSGLPNWTPDTQRDLMENKNSCFSPTDLHFVTFDPNIQALNPNINMYSDLSLILFQFQILYLSWRHDPWP